MRPILIALFLFLPGVAPAQQICEELWFARNLVFDRAGYCFGSVLGRAVFDNSDCSTDTPQAGPGQQWVVDQALQLETE